MNQLNHKHNKPPKKPNSQLKQIASLSGVAIQMGITIYLFVIAGKWLDIKYTDGKVFLIIMTLLGVAISLYVVLKQLKSLDNK